MLVSMSKINKYYNGNQVLNNINLSIDENDRIGLIGINGCGKTTLLKILTGKELPDKLVDDEGIISYSGKTTIGYLEQINDLENENTVITEMKNVFSSLFDTLNRMKELEKLMSEKNDLFHKLSDEYAKLSSYFEANDGYNINVKIKTILNGLGFDENKFERKITSFSGGEKTRLSIAKLLLENPNLLILDEPTNHLDFKTVLWLEDYLKDYKGALLIVSHDRYFLDKIVTNICEIERGEITRYKGNYSKYLILKEESVNRQQKEYELQQKEIAKMEEYVAKNLVRASTSKSAKSRVKALEKMDRIEKPILKNKNSIIDFNYTIEPHSEILKVKNIDISVGIGENKKILKDNISFEIRRGDKIAIIGENGIGKSTLLKIIQNKHPFNGRLSWGGNVKISYFEQESANLNPDNTLMEEIHSRYSLMTDLEIRSLLGKVRLTGENVFKKISVVSGGERAKLCFALMMLERGNVLILDEPTNHLDLATKEILEEALINYTGTIIYVSHDRYLLNKLSTKIMEITKEDLEIFDGNFDYYIQIQKQREQQLQEKIDEIKQQKVKEQLQEKNTKVYKSKEQRNKEAQKRTQIKNLEMEIESLQSKLDELQVEITKENVYSDYNLMNDFCLEIDNIKNKINEKFDEWAILSDE